VEASTAGIPLWCVQPPEYESSISEQAPVFVRPALHGRVRLACARAFRHPFRVARALVHTRRPVAVLTFLLWRETAQWFGYIRVRTPGVKEKALEPLLAPLRPSRRPAEGGGADLITGLVIAQDEEALIGRALDSLAPFVQETVVVDGGSRDRTPEIAEEHGAVLVHRPFDRDYAAQRNAGLDHVKTSWALCIDCDEVLSPELGQLLVSIAANCSVDAVFAPIHSLVGDDPKPTLFPDVQPRLFRSHLRFRGRVHERLATRTAVYLPVNGPQIEHRKTPLRHYRNSLRYSEIDPGQSTPELVAWMKTEVARLEGQELSEPDA
jgi:hypothetical protein